MLNYIIPPAIVILGTAFLVYFLFKKIDKLPAEEIFRPDDQNKKPRKILGSFWKYFSQALLKILEKLVQKFKIYSMKFHNLSQSWFQSIKKKREVSFEKKDVAEPAEPQEPVSEDNIPRISIQQKIRNLSGNRPITTEEIKTGPMVSNRVVLPNDRERESKDKFEQALIERIATNPQDIEAYERLGDHYIESNNYEESLECFKYVLKLSPINRKAGARVRRLQKMLGK